MLWRLFTNALCSYPLKLEIQKFWKVKAQFSLNFVPNLKISVLTGKELYKIWGKNIFLHICQICVIWSQKTCCGCGRNFKFCTDANYVVLKKTRQNNFFLPGPQHGQNGIWNLEIFVEYFHHLKIFGVLIWGWCSTCPHNFIHILPAECLNCNWFFGNFYCCSRLWSTRTQI